MWQGARKWEKGGRRQRLGIVSIPSCLHPVRPATEVAGPTGPAHLAAAAECEGSEWVAGEGGEVEGEGWSEEQWR